MKSLRAKPGDLVAINESGKIVKAMDDSIDKIVGVVDGNYNVYEDIGVAVYNPMGIVTINPRLCSLCKTDEYTHKNMLWYDEIGHPFFNNNLEYLEWKSEQHEQNNNSKII